MSSRDADSLARLLTDHERRLKATERSSQMSNRSMSTGAGGVKVTDAAGTVVGTVGLDNDGAALADLKVGSLTTGSLRTDTKIIAGDEMSTHAELSGTGLRVFADDFRGDGIPDEVVRLGTSNNDFFAITAPNGTLRASIDQNGRGQFTSINVEAWPQIGARMLSGETGGRLDEVLDRMPRGLVGWGAVYGRSPFTTGITGIFEFAVTLRAGRMYEFSSSPLTVINDSNAPDAALVEVALRYTSSTTGTPAAPTVNSPIFAMSRVHTGTGVGESITLNKILLTQDANYRFLLCIRRLIGGGNVAIEGRDGSSVMEVWVKDIGRSSPNLQTLSGGGGTVVGGTPPPVPTAPPRQQYRVDAVAQWCQTYRGTQLLDSASASNDGIQGPQGGYSHRAYFGFNNLLGYLNGATIDAVWLFLYSNHWYYNSGGTAVIGHHQELNPPNRWDPPNRNEGFIYSAGMSKPGGRWLDISSMAKEAWGDGRIRGVMVGGDLGTDNIFYGRFDGPGDANPPQLQVTYTK